MADVTLTEVLQLAEKLTPEEQQALIAHLQAEVQRRQASQYWSVHEEFEQKFGLLIFDPGP